MRHCADCGYGYPVEFPFCPECGSEATGPDPRKKQRAASSPDNSWVSICRLDGDLTIDLILGLLDSSNIPSMVTSTAFENESRSPAHACLVSDDTAGHLILVPREFHQEAELLLSAMLGDELEIINVPNM